MFYSTPEFRLSWCIRTLKVSVFSIATVLMLSGCLIESPYWGQEFNSHADKIPLQAWTDRASQPVRLECSKASHGGLHPFPSGSWMSVRSLTPQQPGVLDPNGQRIYSVGKKIRLPSNCWRAETTSSGLRYHTAIRMIQSKPKLSGTGFEDTSYYVLDKKCLECVGRENGKARSWFGYIVAGCTLRFRNSTTQVPNVQIIAKR